MQIFSHDHSFGLLRLFRELSFTQEILSSLAHTCIGRTRSWGGDEVLLQS